MVLSDYLTISEFSKKSGIKRKTLIYYDQIGLFKPQRLNANGYRYYHYHQLYSANMILFFKELGMSLKEIKEYTKIKAPDQMIHLLHNQKKTIQEKQNYYAKMQEMLDLQLESLNEYLTIDYLKISLVTQEATPLLFNPNTHSAPHSRVSAALSELYQYTITSGYDFPYPAGVLVSQENKKSGDIARLRYYAKVPNSKVSRPKGEYLLCYLQGSMDYKETYCQMLKYAQLNQLIVVGDLYIDFILNDLVSQNFEEFLLKMLLPVKKAP